MIVILAGPWERLQNQNVILVVSSGTNRAFKVELVPKESIPKRLHFFGLWFCLLNYTSSTFLLYFLQKSGVFLPSYKKHCGWRRVREGGIVGIFFFGTNLTLKAWLVPEETTIFVLSVFCCSPNSAIETGLDFFHVSNFWNCNFQSFCPPCV